MFYCYRASTFFTGIILMVLGSFSCDTSQPDKKIDTDTLSIYNKMDSTNNNILLMPVLIKGLWGYMDTSGQIVISPKYTVANGFTENLAAVKNDTLWGFIDRKGNWKISPAFDSCQPFFGGMAGVMTKGLWGFIDKSGTPKISEQYSAVKPFSEGLSAVSDGKKWGFINEDNTEVIPFKYDNVYLSFYKNRASVLLSKKVQFIDNKGQQAAEEFPLVYRIGLASCRGDNGKMGWVNEEGIFVIQPQYFIAGNFSEGLAGAGKLNELVGFIDTVGKMVISPSYLMVGEFNVGLAPAQDGASMKWGFIDKQNKWIIAPQFFTASNFSGDCAPASTRENEWRLVDRQGQFKSDIYLDIVSIKHGLTLSGADAVVNSLRRQDVPFSVLGSESNIEDLYWAQNDAGWIVIDSKGKKILESSQPMRAAFN
ncbi:hypothetical protein BH09BAC5_BH09BAC5_07820 [soil metagenome]